MPTPTPRSRVGGERDRRPARRQRAGRGRERLTDRAVQNGNPSEFTLTLPEHRRGPTVDHKAAREMTKLALARQNTRSTAVFGSYFRSIPQFWRFIRAVAGLCEAASSTIGGGWVGKHWRTSAQMLWADATRLIKVDLALPANGAHVRLAIGVRGLTLHHGVLQFSGARVDRRGELHARPSPRL